MLAPIILLVYNRLWHTQQVVAALANNFLSQDSELHIYADAAKNEEAIEQVNLLRNYLYTITGFKTVHICLRETNLGVDENTIQAVTEVVNRHDQAIVLEDDLVTSPWFLKFMNDGLDYYRHQDNVASIHGYVYPITQPLKEVFFLKGADCWGWATWKRAWDVFERDGQKLVDGILARGLQREFDFNHSYPYFNALKSQAMGHTSEWDIRWYASAFLAEKLTLYPGQSLVRNIGHDASGTHCTASTNFDVALANAALSVATDTIPDQQAYQAFTDFFTRLLAPNAVPAKGFLSRSFKKIKGFITKSPE